MSGTRIAPPAGGCQCGAVRYMVAGELTAPSICHCRMCQKAFGNVFAPLVTAKGLVYTRGTPKRFASSNKVKRGFCAACGTPLTYEFEGLEVEIAIATLDDPSAIAPLVQLGLESRQPWTAGLSSLPIRSPSEAAYSAALFEGLRSNQHPDGESARD